jgi:hypothetical protein
MRASPVTGYSSRALLGAESGNFLSYVFLLGEEGDLGVCGTEGSTQHGSMIGFHALHTTRQRLSSKNKTPAFHFKLAHSSDLIAWTLQ